MVPRSRPDVRDERPRDTGGEQKPAAVQTAILSHALTLSPQLFAAQQTRSQQSREDLEWMRKLEGLGGNTLEPSMADMDETASSSHEDGQSDEEGGGPSQARSSKATTAETERAAPSTAKRRSSAPVSMNKRRARGRTRGSLSAALGRGPFHIASTGLDDDVTASANAQSAAISEEMAADQRKAQNRLAQREFRQRKQQYIRALEARVELLSSDHDTQVDRLRYTLRGLLDENNQLRQLLASFASFVGLQQIGGPLQRAGMSRQELEELLLHSTSEQRLTDAWHNWPHAQESEALRQIRLESNLPPEGLPESSRLSEQAKANNARKQQQQKQKQQEAADADLRSQKRKALSVDESQTQQVTSPLLAGTGVTRPASGAAEKSVTMSLPFSRSSSSSSGPQVPYAPSSQLATNASESSASSTLSNALAGYFPVAGYDSAPSQASQPANAPPASASVSTPTTTFAFTPSAYAEFAVPGMPAPSLTPDGNSLFASLFDSSGLASYMNATRQSLQPATPSALMSGMPVPMPFQTPSQQQQQQGQSSIFGSRLSAMQPQVQHRKISLGLTGDADPQNMRRYTIMFDRIANRQREQRVRRQSGRALDSMSPSSPTVASEQLDLDELRRAMLQMVEQARLYATQPRHTLPRILEPSEAQRTQPHDPLIDALPYPPIRASLIAQQDSIDVPEAVEFLLESTILHPGDIFDQTNWEVTQRFILAYPKLVDRGIIENANRWRASRKERFLMTEDVSTGRT